MSKSVALMAVSSLALSTAAWADPVSIDGTLGSEWAGANMVSVAYNSAAPTSNFGAPTSENHNVAYSIYTRQDAEYIYVGLQTSGSSGGLDFANLYFGSPSPIGSTIGFEVGASSRTAFIPGGPGGFNANSLTFSALTSNASQSTIEFAVPFSFFTGDPLDMSTNPLIQTTDFNLRLSQSFGYSVAGGASYGDPRLGSFNLTVVPLPSAALSGMAGIGGLAGLSFFSRMRRRVQA